MKKLFSYILLIILCIGTVSAAFAGGFVSDGDQIEKATKSVLKLYVYDSPSAAEDKYIATGSGFVAFNSSTLITNYHVIDGAAMVRASDDDGRFYVLDKVFCADKKADIAILGFESPTSLAPLDLFADDQLKRGSPVVAIGSPKGLKNTVSTGVISYQYDEEGVPMIQMTAPISPGSSGGALFNDDGKVIGVTSASYKSEDEYGEDTGAQNLNFAVNIAAAKAMYKAWDGQEHIFGNFSNIAKMDYTGVYDNSGVNQAAIPDEKWTCLKCGHENTTKFCMECGAEKPFWVCACGRVNSSNKYCGDCGKSLTGQVQSYDEAMEAVSQNNYSVAITLLESLGAFDSGSIATSTGDHAQAKIRLPELYYEYGMYLRLNNGDYDEIILCFRKAGDYEDAPDMLNKAYYEKAENCIEQKHYDEAISIFESIIDYSDAGEKIKEVYYLQGLKALEEGNIDEALVLFEKAGDYPAVQDMIKKVEALKLEKELDNINTNPETMTQSDLDELSNVLNKATALSENEYAKDIIKRIRYIIGQFYYAEEMYESAIDNFTWAGDYSDAAYMLSKCRSTKIELLIHQGDISKAAEYCGFHKEELIEAGFKATVFTLGIKQLEQKEYESAIDFLTGVVDYIVSEVKQEEIVEKGLIPMINEGKTEQAFNLYEKVLVPSGCTDDIVIVCPGSEGYAVRSVFNLLSLLGDKKKSFAVKDVYKEDDIPYVQDLETHFGMKADGVITLGEYSYLMRCIYQGSESSKVCDLLEKLADLTYIAKLPEVHNKYEAKYVSSVEKAEQELGLVADGIITPNEYDAIMAREVAKPEKVQNLKMSVKNDNVTLTWSKVPGALYYEIQVVEIPQIGEIASNSNAEELNGLLSNNIDGNNDGVLEGVLTSLGKTDKTQWSDKGIPTGAQREYIVIAHKYTVKSDECRVGQYIEKYYCKVSLSQLNKSDDGYMRRYVDLNNLPVLGYMVKGPDDADYHEINANEMVLLDYMKAANNSDYDVRVICAQGNNAICFQIKDYKSWNSKLLLNRNTVKSFSARGKVVETRPGNRKYGRFSIVEVDWFEYK